MSLFQRKDNRRSDTATGRRLASTPVNPRCPEIRPYPRTPEPLWQCDQDEGHLGEHWFDDGIMKNRWTNGTVRAVCHASDQTKTRRCDLDLDHEGNHAGGEGIYRCAWRQVESSTIPEALEEILAAVQSAVSTMRSGDKGTFWSAEEHRQNGIAQDRKSTRLNSSH